MFLEVAVGLSFGLKRILLADHAYTSPVVKKRDKREQLFALCAKNLSIYLPKVTDKFLCPMCKQLFSRSDLNCRSSSISLAHIIPE